MRKRSQLETEIAPRGLEKLESTEPRLEIAPVLGGFVHASRAGNVHGRQTAATGVLVSTRDVYILGLRCPPSLRWRGRSLTAGVSKHEQGRGYNLVPRNDKHLECRENLLFSGDSSKRSGFVAFRFLRIKFICCLQIRSMLLYWA